MALTPNFSASESLSSPSIVTLTDTSTGSDGSLTSRIVYFRLANGTYLTSAGNVNDYEIWPIANTSQTFDILPRSEAVFVTVIWLSGTSQKYELLTLEGFNLFDYIFGYKRLQNLTGSPRLIDNPNYFNGMIQLITNIFCADTAITYGNDIYSAQEAFNRNYEIITNPNVLF